MPYTVGKKASQKGKDRKGGEGIATATPREKDTTVRNGNHRESKKGRIGKIGSPKMARSERIGFISVNSDRCLKEQLQEIC